MNLSFKKNERSVELLKKYFFRPLFISGVLLLCQCHKNASPSAPAPVFDSVPTVKPLIPLVNEISGIADSKLNPGYLWGIEDSGNPPQLYLIGHEGIVSKKIFLKGITNRDWEEVTLCNGNIYIAETGDNAAVYNNYSFYKFSEPSSSVDTVSTIETISFTYPDGSHDAEAFLIDSSSKNIYIITKWDNPSKIYRLNYPYQSNNIVTLVGSLPYTGVVSAAGFGNEIIIKTYTDLFYYQRSQNENIEQSLKKSYTHLPYVIEPQGEAVSFADNGAGYYTISEKSFAPSVNIYFYKRK
jgi:hypothetical protein